MPQISFAALHPAQEQIVREARRFNVVCAGRRFGKNVLALELLIMPALEGKPVAFFSATNKLLADAWREFCSILAPVTVRKLEQEHRLEIKGGGAIDCWSLESDGAGRGRKYARAVIDEAAHYARLEEAWTKNIRPTLIDFEGDAWFLSTPKGRNYFWTLYQKGQSEDSAEWMSWQFPSSANPLLNPKEIEDARANEPELAFAQEWLAIFIVDGGTVFRKVTDAIDRGRRETSIITDTSLQFGLGVDLAKHVDFFVATIFASTGEQVYFERFQDISWPRQIAAIKHAYGVLNEVSENALPPGSIKRQLNTPAVILDRGGVGDVVFDELIAAGIYVIPFIPTNVSNMRLHDQFGMALDSGKLRLMDIPEQEMELLAFEIQRTPTGLIRYTAPPGQHDDICVANSLAWYGVNGGGFYSAGAWLVLFVVTLAAWCLGVHSHTWI